MEDMGGRIMRPLTVISLLSLLPLFLAWTGSASAQLAPVEYAPLDNPLDAVSISPDAATRVLGANPITGVPTYEWYYGCGPTAGGMVIGYWDGKPGYGNLFYGDASVQTPATDAMIASQAHITAGAENGYTYGDWHNSASYPNHEANPDCIADYMHVVDAGCNYTDVGPGLEAYVEWDNPTTPINESYEATAGLKEDPLFGGSLSYADLKAEIDADRPVILGVHTYLSPNWWGHAIVAYGYQDDMFVVFSAGLWANVVVPGVAVKDTWTAGTTYGSEWILDSDSDGEPDSYYESYIDGNGVEWWPYYTISDAGGYSFSYYWDWMVGEAITLDIMPVPEPATMALLALGAVALLARRKQPR
jgi:hypothetical protein